MYCRHCGEPAPEDSKFCPECGGMLGVGDGGSISGSGPVDEVVTPSPPIPDQARYPQPAPMQYTQPPYYPPYPQQQASAVNVQTTVKRGGFFRSLLGALGGIVLAVIVVIVIIVVALVLAAGACGSSLIMLPVMGCAFLMLIARPGEI